MKPNEKALLDANLLLFRNVGPPRVEIPGIDAG
jgi:hypothetical protein